MSAVHEAIRVNDVVALRGLLDEDPELIEEERHWNYEGGWQCDLPLQAACRVGAKEAARFLLDRGAEVNGVASVGEGATPLILASRAGWADIVSLLLERGADPTRWSLAEWTALGCAAVSDDDRPGSDHDAVVRLLVRDGRVAVDEWRMDGRTALECACYKGHMERARLLMHEGGADRGLIDPEPYRSDPNSPATKAERKRHIGVIALLELLEGQPEKVFLLIKSRRVLDAKEEIRRAAEKVGARTEAEAQRAREEAAPAYLRGRVERNEMLPWVLVGCSEGWERRRKKRSATDKECDKVYGYIVRDMKRGLFEELMKGLGSP